MRHPTIVVLPSISLLLGLIAAPARAQIGFGNDFTAFNAAPGVMIDTDGRVSVREVDQKEALAAMRKRARDAGEAAKRENLAYVSLADVVRRGQESARAGGAVPDDARYLGGITQLRYVFVYPDEHDLVIAGPAEPWEVHGPNATGTRSGRPVLQLDDLVVALRTARDGGGRLFGCGIYPDPKSLTIAHDIATRLAARPRAERAKALREALGPQEVKIFGTRADTRVAAVCVAADYELKRLALGTDSVPTVALGNAMDHSRSAANKFWFEASYEPLLVSRDGNAYQIRGPRLAVGAGMFDFDPRGATDKAKAFAAKFSKELPAIATAVPLVAELQNVADLSLLANLIRRDRLAEKAGIDVSWLLDDNGYRVVPVPTPKTADTLVSFTSGSMVAGGVMLALDKFTSDSSRQVDEKGTLGPVRSRTGAAGH